MSDLVSRKAVENVIYNLLTTDVKPTNAMESYGIAETAHLIASNIPTAYDVDKVVKQLEDEAELSYADFDRYAEEYGFDTDNDDFRYGMRRAIEIIKKGGKDERSNKI